MPAAGKTPMASTPGWRKTRRLVRFPKKEAANRHVARNRRLPPPHRFRQANRRRRRRQGFRAPVQVLLRHGVRHPEILVGRAQRHRPRPVRGGFPQGGEQQALLQPHEGPSRPCMVQLRGPLHKDDGRSPLVRRRRLRRPKAIWEALRGAFVGQGRIIREEERPGDGLHGHLDRRRDGENQAPHVPFHENTFLRRTGLSFP